MIVATGKAESKSDWAQRRVKTVALVLSLVGSAFLVSLAHRSHEYAWLGWLALLPLLAAVRTCRPVGAMFAGALWGVSLHVFCVGGPGGGISEGFRSLALLTAAPAIYACLGSLLTRRIGFSPFVLGVSWMGVELAFEPLGIRNGLLAGTQGEATLIHWVGGALGYVLVAFLVVTVNASLISALSAARLGSPASFIATGPDASGTRLGPQTFSCFPLFAIPASQPRGPPISAATTA